jgi:hypothetical protein
MAHRSAFVDDLDARSLNMSHSSLTAGVPAVSTTFTPESMIACA